MSYLNETNFQINEFLIDFSSTSFSEYLSYIDINIDNSIETTEKSRNKNKNIELTKKKSGRKRAKDNQEVQEDENIHSKKSKDNIIRKIQVHFLNFILSFINEIIKNYGFEKTFIDLDYKFKKIVNKKYVEKLKSKEIGQILIQEISPKFRKIHANDKEINNKIYLEVIKYDSIRKILSETYINIFRNFYYINKRDINDYGLNIKLSNNVKTYQDLLDKHSEESDYVEKIKKAVKENYLPKKMFTYIKK